MIQQTFSHVVRIETPCKLNLKIVDENDQPSQLIKTDDEQPEVHFVVFEGITKEQPLSFW